MPRSHWPYAPHAIFTALLFFGVSAQAKPEYSDTIPNYGVNSCDTCHPPGDQGSENIVYFEFTSYENSVSLFFPVREALP